MRISVVSLTLFLATAANVADAFVVAPRGAFTAPSPALIALWSSPPENSDDDGGSGGSRFREMMEKAKQTGGRQLGQPDPFAEAKEILEQPTDYQQQQPQVLYDQNGNPVQLPPQPQYFDKDGNPVTLPAQPVQPVQPAQPPPSVQRVKNDGRRAGRNRDADAVANTADVYFAQLKRDSTIRTSARMAGDVETANTPMSHPDIDKMKDLINNNPYLNAERAEQAKEEEEQYRKLMELLETSEDEMLPTGGPTPAEFQAEEERKKEAMKGPSYKDKLMAAKNRQKGGSAAAPEPPTPPPAAPAAPVAATPPPATPAAPATPPPAAPAATAAPPVSASPAAAASAAAAAAAAQQATAMVSEDDIRRKIRVLMGLILKHRGGPGFGSGRLKLEAEIDRFQDTLKDVKALLRSEADLGGLDSVVPPHSAPPAAVSPPSAPAPVETAPAQSTTASPSLEMSPEMRGTAACVEAALQLYRDAKTPQEREALMIPLRSALMSAVNNCNQIIAENELQNKAAYEQMVASAPTAASPPPPPPPLSVDSSAPVSAGEVASNVMGFPSSYAVTQVTEEEETAQPREEEDDAWTAPVAEEGTSSERGSDISVESAPTEEDTNTPILTRVLSDLENVSGSEKFGLKKLNSDEAEKLKDSILEMRSILMEELDKGVPGTTTASP